MSLTICNYGDLQGGIEYGFSRTLNSANIFQALCGMFAVTLHQDNPERKGVVFLHFLCSSVRPHG